MGVGHGGGTWGWDMGEGHGGGTWERGMGMGHGRGAWGWDMGMHGYQKAGHEGQSGMTVE